MVIDANFINRINCETLDDINTNDVIKVEEIQTNIIDNTETNRKIEEKRRFVTADIETRKAEGLRSAERIIEQPERAKAASSTTSTTTSTHIPYDPYRGYPSSRPVEKSTETKAREYADSVFKKTIEDVDGKYKSDKKAKNVWDMFELQEQQEINNLKRGKPVTKKEVKKAKAQIFVLKMAAFAIKATMEVLYVVSAENGRK